jgi:GNAT superfamily N-acetyltransferase
MWGALTRESGIVGIIGAIGEEPEAAILLSIGELWYSKDKVIDEKSMFVRPEFRNAKGGRAARLAEFAKEVQKSLDIPLAIGVLSNERTAGKVRMYQRMFGAPAGAYFLYGGRTGEWKGAAQ